MTGCLFCKIASGEIKTDYLYEDDEIVAFNDLGPQAPMHGLVIPKQHIATLNDLTDDDAQLIGNMVLIAKKIASEKGFSESGFRTVMNCNADGGQSVFHIHLHLLAGRQLSWPPG